jgi:hypothetical protein
MPGRYYSIIAIVKVMFLLLTFWPFTSYSQNALLTDKAISIGLENVDNPPMYFQDEHHQLTGFVPELLNLFLNEQKIEGELIRLPITRLFRALMNNQVTLKVPDNPNWNQEIRKKIDITYSQPFLSTQAGLVGFNNQADLPITEINNIAKIAGYTLVNVSALDEQQMTVYEPRTLAQCLTMAFKHRVQGCYVNITAATYYLKRNHPEQLKAMQVFNHFPLQAAHYHISAIGNDKLIESFNQFLLKNRTKIENLKVKYHLGDTPNLIPAEKLAQSN